ncbi:hypothetical protein [Peptostreptococcus equinus]|uniref:DUF4845 domain-containing protein n=1 Tax=Peptostreptococcus equinus TaxID=3003601 RepID=A0ABY7JM12_9FIRM|nr:hypothetical protein [Peptostreptococcus sp. CBA3647]WAW14394.1 hypothetical protein O0R46_07250 [Peptostreptococcus sp. CBA3647]
MSENKKYIILSIVMTIAIIICILAFAFMPFKELPFIYNEF